MKRAVQCKDLPEKIKEIVCVHHDCVLWKRADKWDHTFNQKCGPWVCYHVRFIDLSGKEILWKDIGLDKHHFNLKHVWYQHPQKIRTGRRRKKWRR